MKYFFTVICFLFLALTLQAQMVMEEIAYVPSPSGYYNNLIVKGNATVNNLETNSFSIKAYSSILNLKLKDTDDMKKILYIDNVTVDHFGGSVALDEGQYNEWMNQTVYEPGTSSQVSSSRNIAFTINGGNLSVAARETGGHFMNISSVAFPSLTQLTVHTKSLQADSSAVVYAKALEIFGMDIPKCNNEYRWQNVKVGTKTYTVLACNNGTPLQELSADLDDNDTPSE